MNLLLNFVFVNLLTQVRQRYFL